MTAACRAGLAGIVLLIASPAAQAQGFSLTDAERSFLTGAVVSLLSCVAAILLLRRSASKRVLGALALLVVLIGAFTVLVLLGGALHESPIAAVFGLLLLFGLFKLMSSFESHSRTPDKR